MFEPRVPLTAAERHVDFERIDGHIVSQRARVEAAATPAARRLAYALVAFHGLVPLPQRQAIQDRLISELDHTARFGFRHAQQEIRAQRSYTSGADRVYAAHVFGDSGDHPYAAQGGLDGVRRLLRRRAYLTAAAVADTARRAYHDTRDRTETVLRAAAYTAAARTLHNHVLELVGETLNLGRIAGALTLANPPEYALRSEQLDKNTCDPCTFEHGAIYQVDSSEFYAHTPPSYCLGAGRCRGIYVFGDTAASVSPERRAA